MSDDKVPMPASGQGSAKLRSDGVGDTGTHGRGGGGESGGGSYDNPHSGKAARGESGGFQGGQSVRDEHQPGQSSGATSDPAAADRDGSDAPPGGSHAPDFAPRVVVSGGQTFEVVQESGIAEAEMSGNLGSDDPDGAERNSPRPG